MTDTGASFDPRRCTLTVPNDLAYLPMIQGFVREYAAGAGLPAARTADASTCSWKRRRPT